MKLRERKLRRIIQEELEGQEEIDFVEEEEEPKFEGDEIYKIVANASDAAMNKIFSGLRNLPQPVILSTEQLTALNQLLLDYMLKVIDDIRNL